MRRSNSLEYERSVFERLTELECEILGRYVNSATPIEIICPQGHRVRVYPQSVICGYNICMICAGKTWDVFYFMENPSNGNCKIGITSGDIRIRLREHRRNGLSKVLRMYIDLADYVAKTLEDDVLASLSDINIKPIKGREYFSSIAIKPIFSLLDVWEDRYYRHHALTERETQQ